MRESNVHEPQQRWNSEDYARNGRFVADLAVDLLDLLAARPGERVLDLGCGDGALTERLQASGAQVTGVDRSPEMVQAARVRGLRVYEASGDALPFEGEFDAVFSNAALHWIADQEAVLRGVHRALRPGGRFVAELGGHGNIAAIRTALKCVLAPLGIDAEKNGGNRFFTVDAYRTLLSQAGFEVKQIQLFARPTLLPGGLREWLLTFRRSLLEGLSAATREQVLQQCETLLSPILTDEQGRVWADYVRLRFVAVRVGN